MCLAVPGEVKSLYPSNGTTMGKVNFGGVIKEVCFAYLPDIQVGDYTIVHVGFAISKIDEASALKTLQTFAELGLLDEELAELQSDEFSEPLESTLGQKGQGGTQ
jgi:hydrogenase expression/formation protein HypC